MMCIMVGIQLWFPRNPFSIKQTRYGVIYYTIYVTFLIEYIMHIFLRMAGLPSPPQITHGMYSLPEYGRYQFDSDMRAHESIVD